MIRKFTFLGLMLVISFYSSGQVNSSTLVKSIVRVEVVIGSKANVCTGFVWQKPDQVVTSLHAMNPSGDIRVLYLNNTWRSAKIKAVLLKADLVLLEIKPGQDPVPSAVVPFTSYNSQKISENTDIKALGYNSGARGISTRSLKKGYVDPETLNNLIPKKDREVLGRIGFPELDLDIIYLDGSLLPGYSGSPVFDPSGKLVGIGDGGLENGASNVSWIIPAKFLPELETSTTTSLPSNFGEITQLFSAQVSIDPSDESIASSSQKDVPAGSADEPEVSSFVQYDESGESYYNGAFEEYAPVKSSDFEFYLTKERSLDEMAETSEDPNSLYTISDYVEAFNVKLDYEDLRFDIYEDVNYGVVLAVPKGEDFLYDTATGYFKVDYESNPNVDLIYMGVAGDYSQTDFQEAINNILISVPPLIQDEWAVENFTVDYDFSHQVELEGGRKIANILMVSEDFDDPQFGGNSKVYLYITLLMSNDKAFMAVASFCMSDEKLNSAMQNGLDCLNYTSEDCDYFDSLIKVFCAAHLTTFAY
jgi:hypothetical protein